MNRNSPLFINIFVSQSYPHHKNTNNSHFLFKEVDKTIKSNILLGGPWTLSSSVRQEKRKRETGVKELV